MTVKKFPVKHENLKAARTGFNITVLQMNQTFLSLRNQRLFEAEGSEGFQVYETTSLQPKLPI